MAKLYYDGVRMKLMTPEQDFIARAKRINMPVLALLKHHQECVKLDPLYARVYKNMSKEAGISTYSRTTLALLNVKKLKAFVS